MSANPDLRFGASPALTGTALRTAEPGLHLSFVDAMWWALTTATTVGYGDIVPHTDAGQAIAAAVMLVGIGFVALLTAAMARLYFEPATSRIESEEQSALRALDEISRRLDRIESHLATRNDTAAADGG